MCVCVRERERVRVRCLFDEFLELQETRRIQVNLYSKMFAPGEGCTYKFNLLYKYRQTPTSRLIIQIVDNQEVL